MVLLTRIQDNERERTFELYLSSSEGVFGHLEFMTQYIFPKISATFDGGRLVGKH